MKILFKFISLFLLFILLNGCETSQIENSIKIKDTNIIKKNNSLKLTKTENIKQKRNNK